MAGKSNASLPAAMPFVVSIAVIGEQQRTADGGDDENNEGHDGAVSSGAKSR
jgi:hypothetical protein